MNCKYHPLKRIVQNSSNLLSSKGPRRTKPHLGKQRRQFAEGYSDYGGGLTTVSLIRSDGSLDKNGIASYLRIKS